MKTFLFAAALAILVPVAAFGQAMNHDQLMHGQASMMTNGMLPQESGQSAFAAIREIVAMLEADPSTDWSKVDIETLRQHLIDMSNVTLLARVENTPLVGGMKYFISGVGEVKDSIQRMVVAHADTMNGAGGWGYVAERTSSGASLIVTPPDKVSVAKLRALDFIGIMSRGVHHQQHHFMIAKGLGPHR